MALRLIESVSPSVPRVVDASELADRALVFLTAGDAAGYRGLFAQAGAVEHPQRRYQARLAVAEAGFTAVSGTDAELAANVLLTIAQATVEALEAEPREPMLLNAAGVALYELGSLEAAQRLFLAARRLDPALPHVDANLQQTADGLRERRSAVLPRTVAAALPPLAARAVKCAARAQPATGLTLSLCMIVRDEEAMLPRCLAAVRDAVDEIVIVDTGSVDATVEIAESFGARVLHREWTGSFSDARNASFEAATGDWVMYLDADEVLVADDAAELRALTGRTWREAFYLSETSYVGELADGEAVTHAALRLFRNRPEYRFEGRLHEQIGDCLPLYLPERVESTSIRVEHFGYLGAVRDTKQKSQRNVELLERQRAEGGDTPFLGFNLGSEHAAVGDHRSAVEEFARVWPILRADAARARSTAFVPTLVSRYARALRGCGELEAADRVAGEGLELFPGFTDLVLAQAQAAADAGDRDRAAELFERCLAMGDAPIGYTATVGAGTFLALMALAALRRDQGDAAAAEALLDRSLTEHPAYLGAVEPLVQLMLARGVAAEAVVAHVGDRIGEPPPTARFVLALALYEAGHAEAAEPHFRDVVRRQPATADVARLGLAETLLSQARYAEAAAEAAHVDARGTFAPAALRARLFGLIMAGDDAGAGALLQDDALPEEELAAFAAWREAANGRPTPERLPAAGAGLLATALEALLPVGDVDAAAKLVDLLDRTELAWRDRREQLAEIFLRRGFLDSAADEWIAVCQESAPDARALVGLAQVALARDLPEEALVLAEGARELDPSHAGAARLTAHLVA